jgi:tRNA threonylcarbamoyladenosine biosynthesis protein TsaB
LKPPGIAGMVRKFESRDAQAVEQILRKSPQAAAWSRKSLEQLIGRGELAWVIETAGGVVGFLVARAVVAEAEILNLSIEPEERRAGNATALLQEGMAEFRRLGVRKIFLEVRESNLAAISFYERNAFVRNGLRLAYYQNPTEAAVLMMRELTG